MYFAFWKLLRSRNATNSTRHGCNLSGATGQRMLLQYILGVEVVCLGYWVEEGEIQNMEIFSTRFFSGVKTQKWKTCVQTNLPRVSNSIPSQIKVLNQHSCYCFLPPSPMLLSNLRMPRDSLPYMDNRYQAVKTPHRILKSPDQMITSSFSTHPEY